MRRRIACLLCALYVTGCSTVRPPSDEQWLQNQIEQKQAAQDLETKHGWLILLAPLRMLEGLNH